MSSAVQHKATEPPNSPRKLSRTTVVNSEFGQPFVPRELPVLCEDIAAESSSHVAGSQVSEEL